MGRTSDARERLIEAAGDLWHRRSYTDVGVGEICAEAGVQKGSFYHFFPSKQDLALAVIDDRWEHGDRATDQRPDDVRAAAAGAPPGAPRAGPRRSSTT